MERQIDGILVVKKEAGFTSRDVVNKVSKLLDIKRIGHTGTLDPLATGVLVLTIGKCTKMTDFLTSTYKEYEAKFELGYETDTLDVTGQLTKKGNKDVSLDQIKTSVMSFKGHYDQEVPKYSAVKIKGKRLYEYARNGEDVTLPKRNVEIREIEFLGYEDGSVYIRCLVSKGTYIRSLIRDIGVNLGTYATMSELLRTKQGMFDIKDAYSIDEIEKGHFKLLSIDEVLKDVPSIEVDDELYKKVSNGQKLSIDSNSSFLKFLKGNNLIALYKNEDGFYKMFIKF